MQDDPPRDKDAMSVHTQASLKDWAATDDEDAPDRCRAWADSTGERCRHRPLSGLPYCSDHAHLIDEVDIIRHGLKALKSDGSEETPQGAREWRG